MAESTIISVQFVRISQVPASLGERILARIIDYFLLFIYILATSYILGKLNIHAFSGSTFFLLFLFIYLPVLCYSLLCEVFNQGQSAGKKLMNIRVVKADGTTPSLSAYLLRWLLYGIDVTITGGLGVLVILLTKNSQRLGDLAAGTMVIKEKNYRKIQVSLDEFDYLTKGYHPSFPSAADLSLEQINVISKALELHHKDRTRHIAQLAPKVRALLSVDQTNINDEKFLQTVVRDYQYYALEEI